MNSSKGYYEEKYLKYKNKYLLLKKITQIGGAMSIDDKCVNCGTSLNANDTNCSNCNYPVGGFPPPPPYPPTFLLSTSSDRSTLVPFNAHSSSSAGGSSVPFSFSYCQPPPPPTANQVFSEVNLKISNRATPPNRRIIISSNNIHHLNRSPLFKKDNIALSRSSSVPFAEDALDGATANNNIYAPKSNIFTVSATDEILKILAEYHDPGFLKVLLADYCSSYGNLLTDKIYDDIGRKLNVSKDQYAKIVRLNFKIAFTSCFLVNALHPTANTSLLRLLANPLKLGSTEPYNPPTIYVVDVANVAGSWCTENGLNYQIHGDNAVKKIYKSMKECNDCGIAIIGVFNKYSWAKLFNKRPSDLHGIYFPEKNRNNFFAACVISDIELDSTEADDTLTLGLVNLLTSGVDNPRKICLVSSDNTTKEKADKNTNIVSSGVLHASMMRLNSLKPREMALSNLQMRGTEFIKLLNNGIHQDTTESTPTYPTHVLYSYEVISRLEHSLKIPELVAKLSTDSDYFCSLYSSCSTSSYQVFPDHVTTISPYLEKLNYKIVDGTLVIPYQFLKQTKCSSEYCTCTGYTNVRTSTQDYPEKNEKCHNCNCTFTYHMIKCLELDNGQIDTIKKSSSSNSSSSFTKRGGSASK